MVLFNLAYWPLMFVCAAMIVAAVIDGWKLKVPNWLTFPLILSGWLLGLLHNRGLAETYGRAGRQRVEAVFPIERMLSETEALYLGGRASVDISPRISE